MALRSWCWMGPTGCSAPDYHRYLLLATQNAGVRPEQQYAVLGHSGRRIYRDLFYEHMDNSPVIRIESEHVTADQVRQMLYHASTREWRFLLLMLLHQQKP